MREDLYERVLHRLVGVGRVAEVLIGDAEGASLMQCDEVCEPLACGIAVAVLQQLANFDRQTRVVALRAHGVRARRTELRPGTRRCTLRPDAVGNAGLLTH